MRKLVIGIAVVALLGLLAVPIMATVGTREASIPIQLNIDKYAHVEVGGGYTGDMGAPIVLTVVDNPIHPESGYFETITAGTLGGGVHYKIWANFHTTYTVDAQLSDDIKIAHPNWVLWPAGGGAYPSDKDYTFGDPGRGLGSAVYLSTNETGGAWNLDADVWKNNTEIGTFTITVQGLP